MSVTTRSLSAALTAAFAAFFALILTGGVVLAGCGGSGSKGGVTDADGYMLSKSKNTGQLTLTIKWPARTTSGTRVIPTAATGIQLQVVSQSGIFTSTGTNTFTAPSIPYGTPSYTVSSVPAGSATIVASAVLKQASGTIVLANVSPTSVSVSAGQVTPLNLTLAATLTTSTTVVTATIQKVLNPDGTTVSASDPAAVPQPLATGTFNSPFSSLQDKAVYEVVASIAASGATTPLALPTASEFSFDIENDYDLTGNTSTFLTAVDATGKPLNVRPAVGNAAYFKVSLAGTNGELYIPLNATQFSDPNSYTVPYAVYYLASPGFVP